MIGSVLAGGAGGLRPAASGPAAGAQAGFLAVLRLTTRLTRRAIALRSMARIGGHRRRYAAGFSRQVTMRRKSIRRTMRNEPGRKADRPTSRLPIPTHFTMLRRCSSFPKQKPPRSVPHSSSKASCRPRSSCGACSPVSPTIGRRGMSRASSPLGSRYRHALPGGFGAGSPEAVPRDARRHAVGTSGADLTLAIGSR